MNTDGEPETVQPSITRRRVVFLTTHRVPNKVDGILRKMIIVVIHLNLSWLSACDNGAFVESLLLIIFFIANGKLFYSPKLTDFHDPTLFHLFIEPFLVQLLIMYACLHFTNILTGEWLKAV